MTKEIFAQLLKDYRIKNGKSLYDIAQLFNTGSGTVSRWENGHAAPPEVARLAIIELLEKLKGEQL